MFALGFNVLCAKLYFFWVPDFFLSVARRSKQRCKTLKLFFVFHLYYCCCNLFSSFFLRLLQHTTPHTPSANRPTYEWTDFVLKIATPNNHRIRILAPTDRHTGGEKFFVMATSIL